MSKIIPSIVATICSLIIFVYWIITKKPMSDFAIFCIMITALFGNATAAIVIYSVNK